MPKLIAPLALLAGLAACASSGSPSVANTRTTTPYDEGHVFQRVTLSSADSARVQLGENGHAELVPLSSDRAWAGLVRAFPALGLEVIQTDVVGHALAGKIMRSRRPFGGHSYAELMNCGETAGIPNAGRWDITMQVATKLVPHGRDSTIVASWVVASAKPGGTAGEESDCVANERIGTIVADMVNREGAESPKAPTQ